MFHSVMLAKNIYEKNTKMVSPMRGINTLLTNEPINMTTEV